MKCSLCRSVPKFRELGFENVFCDAICQEAFHSIGNPLETLDTVYQFLLRVPPTKLFDFFQVSLLHHSVLSDSRFMSAYSEKWTISDSMYLRAMAQHREWLPYLQKYDGFFHPDEPMRKSFKRAVYEGRVEIVRLFLDNFEIPKEDVRYAIEHTMYYDMLELLFRYGDPTAEDLNNAVIANASENVILLMLKTGKITDVSDALRMALTFGYYSVIPHLEYYEPQNKRRK